TIPLKLRRNGSLVHAVDVSERVLSRERWDYYYSHQTYDPDTNLPMKSIYQIGVCGACKLHLTSSMDHFRVVFAGRYYNPSYLYRTCKNHRDVYLSSRYIACLRLLPIYKWRRG